MAKSPRRFLPLALTCLCLAALGGCSKGGVPSGAGPAAAAADPAPAADPVSQAKLERKVIKNAELSVTVASPTAAQEAARHIAERHAGYLATSESSDGANEDGAGPNSVRVSLRVKAEDFDLALAELKQLGNHVGSENVSSKDVTEEWVDLDARLKTQKQLEAQYLEILKSASKVDDLLAVQKQLAEVRGEIEKIEGRRRYLDNQVSLSSITVTFERTRPLVAVSGSAFGNAFRRAGSDAVNVSANIVIGTIRTAGVLGPVALLVFLPLLLIGRFTLRRLSRPAQ